MTEQQLKLMRAVLLQKRLGEWFRPSEIQGLDFKAAPVASQLCNGSTTYLQRNWDQIGYYRLSGNAPTHLNVHANVEGLPEFIIPHELWKNGVGGHGVSFRITSSFLNNPPDDLRFTVGEIHSTADIASPDSDYHWVYASWTGEGSGRTDLNLLAWAYSLLENLKRQEIMADISKRKNP